MDVFTLLDIVHTVCCTLSLLTRLGRMIPLILLLAATAAPVSPTPLSTTTTTTTPTPTTNAATTTAIHIAHNVYSGRRLVRMRRRPKNRFVVTDKRIKR